MINPLLGEFVTFARYMSISRASDALFVSQSSLSKHLKKLETELGFELTYKQGNQLLLTDEGVHFLRGIQSILTDYEDLVNECIQIKENTYPRLILQDPPYSDFACSAFFNIAEHIKSALRPVKIDFIHEKFKDLRRLLLCGEADLLLEYHCKDTKEIKESFEEKGIFSVCISEEPLAIWGRDYLFDATKPFNINDLRNLSIMVSSDASSPTVGVLDELPELIGFAPKICISAARNAPEFFSESTKKGVYLLPASVTTKEAFTSKKHMAATTVDPELACFKAFALLNQDNKYFDILAPILIDAENNRTIPQ